DANRAATRCSIRERQRARNARAAHWHGGVNQQECDCKYTNYRRRIHAKQPRNAPISSGRKYTNYRRRVHAKQLRNAPASSGRKYTNYRRRVHAQTSLETHPVRAVVSIRTIDFALADPPEPLSSFT